jgi:lactose/L-arabinose transport system permease protein
MVGKKKMGLSKKRNLAGWMFLLPAVLLICWMSFYPMIKALILSFHTGIGNNMKFAGSYNYTRMIHDSVFKEAIFNNFFYLIIQVPIMLILALVLASMLNNKNLRFKGLFRTAIFLPCATSLVSYAIIFRALFSLDGFVNTILLKTGIIDIAINWLANPGTARAVIIFALIWRWTGYNMVFYLAGLQNIEYSIYEAAKIDGAGPFQQFRKITIPLLKPMILLTAIMSTNGLAASIQSGTTGFCQLARPYPDRLPSRRTENEPVAISTPPSSCFLSRAHGSRVQLTRTAAER